MKNIGIVCEGPTDAIVLQEIIDKITGEDNTYLQLQPDPDLTGKYMNGWKGVWKWCWDNAEIKYRIMHEVEPQLDILIIHMDGDVSRKEKMVQCKCNTVECEKRESADPLYCDTGECPVQIPCKVHDQNVEGYIKHIQEVVGETFSDFCDICIAVPCDSTEAWIVAAYDGIADIEGKEDPWMNMIAKGKYYHGIRISGKKKRKLIFEQLAPAVEENWEKVKRICDSAKHFEMDLKMVLDRG